MTKMVVHETWEMGAARDYPVVVHEFRGETEEEAYSVYLAHLETDAFLRGCVEDGRYVRPDGKTIRCTVRWWYDDEDERVARIARAWIAARSGVDREDRTTREAASPREVPPPPETRDERGFRPRVIEGGAGRRPPGHEDHDPAVCDVRTG